MLGAMPAASVRAQNPNTTTPSATQQSIRQMLIDKIEKLKYEKIKDRLGLDDATAEKFFAIYKPAEKDIQSLVMERNAELKALAAATSATTTNEADIAALTEKIKDLNQKIDGREQTLDKDLTPLLTSVQRAKLLVFEHEFNQKVREQLANQTTRAKLRALRQAIRRQRIKNRILKKQAQTKP